jgi:hypothetical protein
MFASYRQNSPSEWRAFPRLFGFVHAVGFLSDTRHRFVFAPASVLSWRRQATGSAAERHE